MGQHKHRRKFTEDLLDNELILESLGIQAGQTIVDAGCGNGYMSKLFAQAVASTGKVYAIDPDEYAIKIFKAEVQGTNVQAVVADITQPTPLDPATVDLIYLSTVFHGFSRNQLKGFLREAVRLLKPDGMLAIVEIEKKETPFGPPLNIRYSPAELKQAIPWAPLQTVQVADHFYMQMFTNKENN